MSVILCLLFAVTPPTVSPRQQLCALVGQTKQNSSVPIKDLRNAPTVVVLDNRSVHLSTYPWRDFSPGAWGPGGSPMMIVLKIISEDKKPLPSGVHMERAWVLFGEELWEISDLRGRRAGKDQNKNSWINCSASPGCEVSVRNGPQWGPGVFVDVVVLLTDREGHQHFLQALKQRVIETV